MIKIIKQTAFTVLFLSFLHISKAQNIEFKRPGLSLQFTALEYTGTYHFPVNNRWFDPEIQYTLNNEQLVIYREYFKKIMVINPNPDTVSIIRNAGLILKEALEHELASWSSIAKSKKRKKKTNEIKYGEDIQLSGLKKGSICLFTAEDFKNSRNLMKLMEEDVGETYSLQNEINVLEAEEDAFFIKYIDGTVIIVGNNQRSVLYGVYDFISKIEKQKTLDRIQLPATTLPAYRLANLWDGVDANESETYLNNKKLFYNYLDADNDVGAQFIYEKLAQMLAYYHINGIVLKGSYAFFSNKYNSTLAIFNKKMMQYGIETYVEISPSFAIDNEKRILDFLKENKNLVSGVVINSINLFGNEYSGGASVANKIANMGLTLIWRDEQMSSEEGEGRNDAIVYSNPDTEKLNEKVVKETIYKNPQKYDDNFFVPAALIDNKLLKSFVLHWWGNNPYVDYTFSDEKSNIAFLIYFYTQESTQTVQFIEKKINDVQP